MRGRRRGVVCLWVASAALVLASCGVDRPAESEPSAAVAPVPAPTSLPDIDVSPQPDAAPIELPPREFPLPEPEPEPEPEPPPALPSPPDAEAVEVAILRTQWGAFGDPRGRHFKGSANLPAGAILAYEVAPSNYDESARMWRMDEGSSLARRGTVATRPRTATLPTMYGDMTVDFEFDVDITGFPCAPSEPQDVLDMQACPFGVRIWFAAVLDGPWGQVRQPSAVLDIVGERGELMTAPPCPGCATLGPQDRARIEYLRPTIEQGNHPRAVTRFVSSHPDLERFGH